MTPTRHIATAVLMAATLAGPALLAPGHASADVAITVPDVFLGGPILPPLSFSVPEAGVTPDPAGRPSPQVPVDECEDDGDGDCMQWGIPAGEDTAIVFPDDALPAVSGGDPEDDTVEASSVRELQVPAAANGAAAAPARPPTPAELVGSQGAIVAPQAANWLRWQTPVLRWRATGGADYYNVQVFRGSRRVLNSWTSRTALRVPRGVLNQGRTYVWVVWPGRGKRADARFGPAIGRSTFQVTLRPRVVFRRAGGRSRVLVGEVRPHIPYGVLRLNAPRAFRDRVPVTVTVGADGRFVLPLTRRQGEALTARLLDRGPTPPIGLRG